MGKNVRLENKPRWKLVIKPVYIMLTLLLSSCATQPKAPVIEIGKAKSHTAVQPGAHKVKAGETLYSIAERSGQDYHDLAALNGLTPPYRVVPGQVLQLSTRVPSVKPATNMREVATSRLTAPKWELKPSPNHTGWVWPAKGAVIRGFNTSGTPKNNGIDIAGQEGDSIFAAAPGKVVYSGNGLRAYGKLVILKHNNNYLSAYGQNRKLLVKEGDMVKVGQKIAEMGRSSTGYAMLHFEIRKAGKPVDPKQYLVAN
jgi:lipoprotein NlpD